jgi:hypothetical protein
MQFRSKGNLPGERNMHRREWFKFGAGAAGLPLMQAVAAGQAPALGPAGAAQGRRLPPLRITDVKTILTQPAGIRLVVG